MAIEDFKMYEEWSRYREELRDQLAAQEQAPKQLVVSTWGRRFGAYLIDNILLAIPVVIYMFTTLDFSSLAGSVDPVTGQPDPAAMQAFIAESFAMQFQTTLILAVLAALYYVAFHATTGQTLGKMAAGIRVVGVDGSKIGWGEAAKRALVNPISNIVPFAGNLIVLLNGLWPLWDEKKQSLGDKLAQTLVVLDR